MKKSEANALLPAGPTSSKLDPNCLTYLMIAAPKWGKTSFFMSNSDAVLLAFEEGHKFQRGHKVIISKWRHGRGSAPEIKKDKEGVPHATFEQAVELLEFSDRFNFVIMDTVDMAVKMCTDYYTQKAGKDHASDMGDYGKGWDLAQNAPFRRLVLRILKTGRGIGFITHSKVEIARFTSGEKAKSTSTMPSGIMRFVEPQADVIVHGEYGRRRKPNRQRDRILVCEGDMDTLAGNRTGTLLPARYVVSPTGQWAQFCKFFTSSKAADIAEAEYARLTKNK